MSSTRLMSGNTPKHEAISIAMEAIRGAYRNPWMYMDHASTKHAHSGQIESIRRELARIHNRLGKRFDGDWMEIEP